MQTPTISELVLGASGLLQHAGVETSMLDSQLLMAHALDSNRIGVISRGPDCASEELSSKFRELVEQRTRRVPLAYITGHREFYGLDMVVADGVLVPRPETEILVEQTLQRLSGREAVVVDVGTGSGAIAVALANSNVSLKVYAVDISANAVKVAEANVSKYALGERVSVLAGDMLEPVIGLGIKCDAVVSNPPYIRAGDLASLQTEVSVHEPRIALDGGCDGLDCYRRLFASVGLVLKDDGFVAVEVGLGQSREVASIAREVGFPRIEFALDLAGVERVVVAAK